MAGRTRIGLSVLAQDDRQKTCEPVGTTEVVPFHKATLERWTNGITPISTRKERRDTIQSAAKFKTCSPKRVFRYFFAFLVTFLTLFRSPNHTRFFAFEIRIPA
jgi:hypothetical protein